VRLGEQVLGLGVHAFLGIWLEGVMVVLGGGLDNWVTAERFEMDGRMIVFSIDVTSLRNSHFR